VRFLERAPAQNTFQGITLLVQIAGLIGTGWLMWSRSILPRLAFETSDRLIAQAFGYALLACGASASITAILYLALVRSWNSDVLPLALRTSATAIWFGPATILLATLSPAAMFAALVLVVSGTRLLYSEWRLVAPEGAASLSFAPNFLGPSFVLAVAFQGAVVSVMFGYPLAAALLVCLSVSLFTLLLLLAGLAAVRERQNLPRSIMGLMLTIILAAGLTTTGAVFGTSSGASSGGPLASARGVLRYLFRPEGRTAPQSTVYLLPPPEDDGNIPNIGYPGVILRPEVQLRTTLVAPPPASIRKPGAPDAALPAAIPFSGEYWLLRPPNARPPLRSYFRRVSPLAQSFTSVDHTTLRMEAHQKLEHEIDLNCCAAIQIAISNGDRYPESVSLELVLADLTEEGSRSLVLGTAEVASWSRSGGETVPEVLNFAVPSHASLTRFNEITVIFHFNPIRDDRSARIAIERFMLIPRS
jgi:hypothetical protein